MNRWLWLLLLTMVLVGCHDAGATPQNGLVPTSPRTPPRRTPIPLHQEVTPMPVSPIGKENLLPSTVYLDEVAVVKEDGGLWLLLSGQLPTPCHRLQVLVQPPDADRRIRVRVFSVVERDQMCVEVLAPFQERVALSETPLPAGDYQVLVNDAKPLTFRWP